MVARRHLSCSKVENEETKRDEEKWSDRECEKLSFLVSDVEAAAAVLIRHSHRGLENLLRWRFRRRIVLQPVLGERDVESDDDAEDSGEPRRVLEDYAHSHAQAEV